MASDKYIVGLWDHEDPYIHAIENLRKDGVEIDNAYTPFPIHGLEHKLGYRDTRLHTAGFVFGLTGLTVALAVMSWVSASNYPTNIGGKPFWALPSFIPITFELTVLFAGVGMFFVYCFRNHLFPGNIPRIFDKRITDDRFALTFSVNEDTDVNGLSDLLSKNGAVEIKEKVFDEDDEILE